MPSRMMIPSLHSFIYVYKHCYVVSQNDRGRPKKTNSDGKFNIFNKTKLQICPFFYLWSCVLCHCHTVLTTRYKGQWSPSPIPIRVWILTLHVSSHCRTYIQQCTFKRQCTTQALVANTQLLLFQVRNTQLTLH